MTHLVVMAVGTRDIIVSRGTLGECNAFILENSSAEYCRIVPVDSPLGQTLARRETYEQGLRIRQAATKVAEAALELIQSEPNKDVVEWANRVTDEAVAIASASYLRNL